MTTFPCLLTTTEAAAVLRVHPRTLMRYASDAAARLPHPVRVGRTVRWSEAALRRWLETST
jgi:excisionase family DNA binding protein